MNQIWRSFDFFQFVANKPSSFWNTLAPLGDGEITIALPHLSALIILLIGVATGFVEGTKAPITPMGLASSVSPNSGILRRIPVVFFPIDHAKAPVFYGSFW